MVKFGFKKENTLSDGLIVYRGKPYFYFKPLLGIGKISIYTPDIKFVHQLQNLYFTLGGEELTITNK